MASEKDQIGAEHCAADLGKPWSSLLCQIEGGIICKVGSFLLNLSFVFHRYNHCFTAVPLNSSRKRLRGGMSTGRYDCTPTQCYRLHTVLSNIWRKSFRSIFDCLLGCEAAVGRLTTWWAALKYTLRIKLFIQDGDMYPACLRLGRRFFFASCSSASLDSISAHQASSHFMKIQTFQKEFKFFADKAG